MNSFKKTWNHRGNNKNNHVVQVDQQSYSIQVSEILYWQQNQDLLSGSYKQQVSFSYICKKGNTCLTFLLSDKEDSLKTSWKTYQM